VTGRLLKLLVEYPTPILIRERIKSISLIPYFKSRTASYVLVSNFLENEDGSAKIEGVLFCYLPLAAALKNQHHDEPGFW
jgi:hypothetical protein